MSKQSITDLNLTRLQEEFASLSLPRYTARQVTEWIYKKRSAHFEDMTNISKKNLLNMRCETRVVTAFLIPAET